MTNGGSIMGLKQLSFTINMLDSADLAKIRHLEDMDSPIGELHIAGDWNNWADSPERAGCVRPSEDTLLISDDNVYSITVDLPRGIHQFKLVIIRAEPYDDGMCAAYWIDCPSDGIGEFRLVKKRGNWEFTIT